MTATTAGVEIVSLAFIAVSGAPSGELMFVGARSNYWCADIDGHCQAEHDGRRLARVRCSQTVLHCTSEFGPFIVASLPRNRSKSMQSLKALTVPLLDR